MMISEHFESIRDKMIGMPSYVTTRKHSTPLTSGSDPTRLRAWMYFRLACSQSPSARVSLRSRCTSRTDPSPQAEPAANGARECMRASVRAGPCRCDVRGGGRCRRWSGPWRRRRGPSGPWTRRTSSAVRRAEETGDGGLDGDGWG
jgi:hypothetical protein